ncbi:tRNA uridine-5-carboxymethylaminomethyl(34) synthesis enzyme MnmG [bacterium]|nr:tRNA uridine-5-carboxymethylaminomethyl(34) synthesis enzyme MnmG [bacterium]
MAQYKKEYDVIVVGGGHAGCEASLASTRMKAKTLLITSSLDNIAHMSCNPAIGGLGKSQLVREIDALGGEMARNIDRTGIQFRMLNTKKGPAVQAPRAQADRRNYRISMRRVLEKEKNLDIKQDLVEKIIVKGERIIGIRTQIGIEYRGKTVILATGTFLKGLILMGKISFPAGRMGEFPADRLSDSLKKIGLKLARLNTCTPPRIEGKTVNFSELIKQPGDTPPSPFSFSTKEIKIEQIPCYLTFTNDATHRVIKKNLKDSPLITGEARGLPPRYCPSVEEKIARFPEKKRHQIFIEPEGRDTTEHYVNGFFTGFSKEIQIEALRTMRGLEKVEITKPGYAIEYDFVFPTQLKPSLETKRIGNLFLAGQINGTSGYEEAAAQGIMAGINAVLKIRGKEPFILNRSEAYIGVLIDDLVTKGTKEPYRMFTSRAEYRLILRCDNADQRLLKYGHRFGLVSRKEYERCQRKYAQVEEEIRRLKKSRARPTKRVNNLLKRLGTDSIKEDTPLSQLLKRPEVRYRDLVKIDEGKKKISSEVAQGVEIALKYEGYIKRELRQIERFKRLEKKRIPSDFNYSKLEGLRMESKEKLNSIRPVSIGQASRISGVNPSDISLLLVYLARGERKKNEQGKRA